MNGNLSAFLMLSLSKHEDVADLKRLRFPSPLEGEGLGMGGCPTRWPCRWSATDALTVGNPQPLHPHPRPFPLKGEGRRGPCFYALLSRHRPVTQTSRDRLIDRRAGDGQASAGLIEGFGEQALIVLLGQPFGLGAIAPSLPDRFGIG